MRKGDSTEVQSALQLSHNIPDNKYWDTSTIYITSLKDVNGDYLIDDGENAFFLMERLGIKMITLFSLVILKSLLKGNEIK
jgi:hypothetical protein